MSTSAVGRTVDRMDGKKAAWERFARADWVQARDAVAAVLYAEPDDREALDGFGQELWWLDERASAIDRWREAYNAARHRGDARLADDIATYLAAGIGSTAATRAPPAGSRARRLLDGLPPGREHGKLAVEDAKRAREPAEAERDARAGLAVAHELGDPDVECMAARVPMPDAARGPRAPCAAGRSSLHLALNTPSARQLDLPDRTADEPRLHPSSGVPAASRVPTRTDREGSRRPVRLHSWAQRRRSSW